MLGEKAARDGREGATTVDREGDSELFSLNGKEKCNFIERRESGGAWGEGKAVQE